MDKLLKVWLKRMKLNESLVSTLLGALVVIVVGVLIFNYFNKDQESLKLEEFTVEEKTSEEVSELPTKHTVQAGENLWVLAEVYYADGFQWSKIATANNLSNPSHLEVGQELTIPQVEMIAKADSDLESISDEKYTVQKGDSLWTIALRAYGDAYQWSKIAEANQLVNPSLIHPGNEFVLPRGK